MDRRALQIVKLNMDGIALQIVKDYIGKSGINIFIVWKAKILRNWKYLISTDLNDGMYYELTYNGSANEWYLDAYQKIENRVIKV